MKNIFRNTIFPLMVGALALLASACSSDEPVAEEKRVLEGVILKKSNNKTLMADGSVDGYNEFDALETSFTR